ncbi:MAG: hypothetical protein EOO52_13170 [Gammaproteobacteria bacterium]|nr:MAG: hypothetical protein EOO52_13170 [Gammaproteobacteria bacterium]
MSLAAGAFVLTALLATLYLLYIGIKPFFIPFSAFKVICSIGKKASISENFDFFKGNFKYEYVDERYNKWRRQLKGRDSLTESENLALQRQTLREITAEAKRRGID